MNIKTLQKLLFYLALHKNRLYTRVMKLIVLMTSLLSATFSF